MISIWSLYKFTMCYMHDSISATETSNVNIKSSTQAQGQSSRKKKIMQSVKCC